MIPSPSALITFSSSVNRSGNPSHGLCAWHLMKGLSILLSSSSSIFIRFSKDSFKPGASKTRYLRVAHSDAIGTFFFTAERVCENLPRPMKSSPSSCEFGQFFVKKLGKLNLLPFLEYISLPVQRHLTPSNFSLMIQPTGSVSSLQF